MHPSTHRDGRHPVRARHVLLAVVITGIWGLNFSVIKLGLRTVDPFVLAGIRFALCALPAIVFVKKPDTPWRFIVGYGLIFGIGLWGVVNLGIKAGLSAGIASLVLQLSAFFTMLLGAVVFGESLSRYQYLGIAVALSGLACIVFVSDGSVTAMGVALVIAGAVSWSVANVIVKKSATSEMFAFVVWSSVFSPIPLFGLSLVVNGSAAFAATWEQLDLAAVGSILFQVYPVTIFGYWAWNSLLRRYPMATVAPFSLLVPVFGILGSVLIFDETISGVKALSIPLIVLGLAVGMLGKRSRHTDISMKEAS